MCGRGEQREGEEGRGGREGEERKWRVEQRRVKVVKGFPPSVHMQTYLLLLVSLGAVKADPDSCSQ